MGRGYSKEEGTGEDRSVNPDATAGNAGHFTVLNVLHRGSADRRLEGQCGFVRLTFPPSSRNDRAAARVNHDAQRIVPGALSRWRHIAVTSFLAGPRTVSKSNERAPKGRHH
jgi:hypothetical protein